MAKKKVVKPKDINPKTNRYKCDKCGREFDVIESSCSVCPYIDCDSTCVTKL